MITLEKLKSYLLETGAYKIIFLGDSITSAEWVHPNWREIFEYVLKEELQKKISDWKIPSWGIRCINSGFDGATTKDLLNKINPEAIDYRPNMFLIMATSNDIFSEITPTEHAANIKRLVDSVYSHNCSIVYCTDICSNNDEYDQRYLPYVNKVKSLFPYREINFINLFEELKRYLKLPLIQKNI